LNLAKLSLKYVMIISIDLKALYCAKFIINKYIFEEHIIKRTHLHTLSYISLSKNTS